MTTYLFIAFGGAAGAVTRHVLAGFGQRLTDGVFPVGTVLVNVLGCGAIGVLAAIFAGPTIVREEIRLGLTVGFLGGFTTFSAFGFQTFALLAERAWWLGAMNIVVSNVAGLLAVWLGYRLALFWQGELG